jgi:MFS family permease
VLAVVVIAFDGLAITTAMPTAVRELGGLGGYGWVFSAFMLANMVGIALTGVRVDRAGPMGPLVAGAACFALGLALGGVAPSMSVLIAGRAVQGFGAGALGAVVYAAVAAWYDEDERPSMLAMLSTAWVVPGLIGPSVAGVATDFVGWRIVFFGLVPVVVVAGAMCVAAFRVHTWTPSTTPAATPFGSALLVAGGVLAALVGLETTGATSGVLIVLGVGAAIAALRNLVPAGTLRAEPGLPAAVAAVGLTSIAFFGAETFFPLLVTGLRGQPSTVAGLALTGASLSWTTGAWIQAREAPRRGRRGLTLVGLVILGVGVAGIGSAVVETVAMAWPVVAWTVAGLGMGIAYTTINLTVLEEAPPDGQGTASASMQLMNVLGVALGAGLGGALIARAERLGWSEGAGFLLAVGLALAALLGALAVASRLPGRRAVQPAGQVPAAGGG